MTDKSQRDALQAKALAIFMHEKYEEYSKQVGWETKEECRVSFNDLPEKNKEVMLLVAKDVLNEARRELPKVFLRIIDSRCKDLKVLKEIEFKASKERGLMAEGRVSENCYMDFIIKEWFKRELK